MVVTDRMRKRARRVRERVAAKPWYLLVRDVYHAFQDDRATRLGAALAFYAVFSVVPFLVIVVPIVGIAVGEDAARVQIVAGLGNLMGAEGASTVGALMDRAASEERSAWATAAGALVLLYAGSRVFRQLKDALNAVWNVRLKAGRGWKGVAEDTLLPLGVMLGLAGVILGSIAFKSWMTSVHDALVTVDSFWRASTIVVLRTGGALAMWTLLFAGVFKFLPDVRIQWRDVWVGAAVTATLFEISKWGISAYLARSDVATGWGPAGFLILFLMWIYLSALFVFVGAEFTQVWANAHGARLEPEDDAEFIGTQWGVREGARGP